MPGGQTAWNSWKEYPEPVSVLIATQPLSDTPKSHQYQQDALQHFFRLIDKRGIDVDAEESFAVLAYENKDVANLQALHNQVSPGPVSKLDDLKKANRRLYRIIYDFLVTIKHKREGEWALACEATDKALTRLAFDDANPRFCSYDDPIVGLNRRAWPVVVWAVMDQLAVDDSETLLDWCKDAKRIIDRAVQQAGGKSILRNKLGILDCRGKSRKITETTKVADEIHAVIRPNLIGDNFRTIHKAKGIQREAILVFVRDPSELESWLLSPDISQDESSRRGYVAFSRARKILYICCENLTFDQRQQLENRDIKIISLGAHQMSLF